MPKTIIDYSNTMIYKITCKDPQVKDVYVGHTTNFVQRKYAHKQSCINDKAANHNCKLYQAIRNNGGWNNWFMEIIGVFNCKDHYEARKKEQEYFDLLHATLNSIEPIPKPSIKPKSIIKRNKYVLFRTKATNKQPKFSCEKCDYNTSHKGHYLRHIETDKHKQLSDTYVDLPPSNLQHSGDDNKYSCECGKSYTHRQSLWKHRKICLQNEKVAAKETTITNNIPMELILEVIKQSKEIQNVLVEQTKELQHKLLEKENQLLEQGEKLLEQNKQLIEMAKKPSMVNSNNNNNNHFNLNLFLNETCKNAMNIQDFINSIKLTTQDFETTGRIGFVDGISRIFINELKRLEVERRPLHCTDVKRETVYIKDNDTWEKENLEKKKLKWAINSIAQLNLNQVQEWQQEYPECRENNTVANTQFNKMAMVALGGFGDEEETKFRDKIVKNVLKEIVVSKEI